MLTGVVRGVGEGEVDVAIQGPFAFDVQVEKTRNEFGCEGDQKSLERAMEG